MILPDKYEGREVNFDLTHQVRNITEDYIGGVENQLARRFGMEIGYLAQFLLAMLYSGKAATGFSMM